uniref:Methyltransferase type 11 domain-containing protein n=1 Tax=viral metagenome TaxID=1070528 RepID=A0A6C0ACS6_9ZZZZ
MEVEHVYSNIAKKFSQTRPKKKTWHGVSKFLNSLKQDDKVCFAGCGNGRNMEYLQDLGITENIYGFDICSEFVDECKGKNFNVIKGNILDPPFEENSFDIALSIAVIHHLKTKEDRIKAVNNLIKLIKPGGRVFIFVWALEQPKDSKRKFIKQDNYVPFKLKNGTINERFYHVYKDQELEEDINTLQKTKIIDHYWEKGNWVIELVKLN